MNDALRSVKLSDVLLLLLALLCFPARAAVVTNTAATVALADVIAARNLCNPGDYIKLPSGSATWTSTLVLTNVSLICETLNTNSTSVITNWTWGTTIIDGVGTGSDSLALIELHILTNLYVPEMGGFAISNGSTHASGNESGILYLYGLGQQQMRLHHIFFDNPGARHVTVNGGLNGVSDHNWHHYGANAQPYLVKNGDINTTSVNGNAAWETNVTTFLGTSNSWIIEDNYFSADGSEFVGMVDAWAGGRFVYRFNHASIRQLHFSNHGTESSQAFRGGRYFEDYYNILNSLSSFSRTTEHRSGGGVAFSETITNATTSTFDLTDYRVDGSTDPWWFGADGTIAWDIADLSDGGGTPGGAGDGVFETGNSSSGATLTVSDSTKSWTTDQWVGYVVRFYTNFTATSAVNSNTITVASASWVTDQWAGYVFTDTSTGRKTVVANNDGTTLTMRSDYYRPPLGGVTTFQLSESGRITANTATQLTIAAQHDWSLVFTNGHKLEIRRVTFGLDQPGAGKSDPLSNVSKPPAADLNQRHTEPLYSWGCTNNGTTYVGYGGAGYYNIQSERDYFNQTNGTFNGSAGVGLGTKAQMNAITGTTTNVGFWVTDEADWRTDNGATKDGQLYRWDGAAWVLYYTPFTYPHPLASGITSGGSGNNLGVRAAGRINRIKLKAK